MKVATAPLRLLLAGAGGHGRVVADIAQEMGCKDIAFLDDRWPQLTATGPWPVIGSLGDVVKHTKGREAAVVSIGDNRKRLELHEQLERAAVTLPVLIHPRATVSDNAEIGAGSVVMAGVVVNVGARVGRAAILNTGSTIDHDCEIGDGVHISPGAHLGGNVRVGDRSWIGIGSAIRHGMHVGDDVMVGAGAAVVANVMAGARIGGVPARPLKDI
jgi:sugar O-acyltransferase (sialic acid O-acetyltransferase NeuD family)